MGTVGIPITQMRKVRCRGHMARVGRAWWTQSYPHQEPSLPTLASLLLSLPLVSLSPLPFPPSHPLSLTQSPSLSHALMQPHPCSRSLAPRPASASAGGEGEKCPRVQMLLPTQHICDSILLAHIPNGVTGTKSLTPCPGNKEPQLHIRNHWRLFFKIFYHS